MENNIIQYIDEKISSDDLIGVEIIYNYALWLEPISYTNYKEHAIKDNKFKSLFKNVINRSLKIKYNAKSDEINNKFNDFIEFEISFGKDGLHPFKDRLYTIICKKCQDFLYEVACNRLTELADLDKKIINFLFSLISQAMENKESFGFSEYGFNPEGCMLKVNTKDWANSFNATLKENLNLTADRFINTFKHGGGMLGPNIKNENVNYWEFYDRLLNLGFGYYVPWVTKAGKVTMHFKIFKKLYENRSQLFTFLEKVSNIVNGKNFAEEQDLRKAWD